MPKWNPCGNKILVRIDPVEKKTASGIILGTSSQSEREQMSQMLGTVVALGPLAYNDQGVPWVAIGDRVKFTKFAGFIHVEDDVEYRVMHDLDILMVMESNDE